MSFNIFEYTEKDGTKFVAAENIEHFSPSDIFDCGQCFRFNKTNHNDDSDIIYTEDYEGIAFSKYIRVFKKDDKENQNTVYFENTDLEEFNKIWRKFFDIDRDYKKIFEELRKDETLKAASEFCPGIRILHQEEFECLISFIFSQNNNIPRIKKIIDRLCENYGEPVIYKNKTYYSFPCPEKIANLELDELDVLKSGFRAKYILDASKKIVSGEINLKSIYDMNLQDGAEYLKRIKGVGDKISACVLLFGYNKLNAFPIDVWIRKVIEKYYSADFSPQEQFGEYAGIAQEYLYYYERKNNQQK